MSGAKTASEIITRDIVFTKTFKVVQVVRANVHVFLFVAHLVFLIFNEVSFFEHGRKWNGGWRRRHDRNAAQVPCVRKRTHAHTDARAEWHTCVTSNSNFMRNLNWKLLSKSIWQLLIGWEQRGCGSRLTCWKERCLDCACLFLQYVSVSIL